MAQAAIGYALSYGAGLTSNANTSVADYIGTQLSSIGTTNYYGTWSTGLESAAGSVASGVGAGASSYAQGEEWNRVAGKTILGAAGLGTLSSVADYGTQELKSWSDSPYWKNTVQYGPLGAAATGLGWLK